MPEQASTQPRIELLFEKFSSFVDGYASNLSMGGMFLATEDLRPVGSVVDFQVRLTDGFRLVQGLGEVVWARRRAAGPDLPPGMAVRFQALDDKGRELILKILEEQVRSGGEPFDVEEVPPDVRLESEESASAGPAPDAAASPADDTEPPPVGSEPPPVDGSESPPDLEKKILGEDGFTLLDAEGALPDPAVVQTDKTFEELAFDAPWGAELPEIPQEVLEERLDAGAALPELEAAPEDPFLAQPEAPEDPFLAQPEAVPEDPFLAQPEAAPEGTDPFAGFEELESPLEPEAVESELAAGTLERQDPLEAALFLAQEAADEIELAPQAEALAEPEFDEIDFGVPAAGEDLAAGVPGADFDDAFEADLDEPSPSMAVDDRAFPDFAAVDGAFDGASPSEDETLLTSEPAAGPSFAEDAALLASEPAAPSFSEDATLLTSEPAAPSFAEDATPVSEPVVSFSEDATLLTSEPAAPSFFEAAAPETPELTPPVPPAAALDAAPVGDEVARPAEATPPGVGIPPLGAEMPPPGAEIRPPGAGSSPAGLGTEEAATAGDGFGTAAEIQDYEEDLFAEAPKAGSFQVLRQALGGRSIAVALGLVALAVAAYFFRGPLAELAGLSGPADSTVTAVDPDQIPPESAGLPATQGGEIVEPGGEAGEASIEEIDVADSLPAGIDVSTDPAAAESAPAAAVEITAPPLAPPPSPAERVEQISARRTDAGTRVTVTLDGELAEERSIHETLDYNPAREMVRITDIGEAYASGMIDVGSPEVRQIRVGHHVKAGRGEVHIVFDYPSVGPRIVEVQKLGDRLEILISGS